jgi:hypothetical protein
MLADGQYCVHYNPPLADRKETYDDFDFTDIEAKQLQGSIVWEMTMDEWQDAIKAWNITKPMIPHRDYSNLAN